MAAIMILLPHLLRDLFHRSAQNAPRSSAMHDPAQGPVFLFDGSILLDCTPAARALLDSTTAQGGDWLRLMAFLLPQFSDIELRLGQLKSLGAFSDMAQLPSGAAMLLQVEMRGGLTKISLTDPDVAEGPGVALAIAHRALSTEVSDLRSMLSVAPILVWRENNAGEIIWVNAPYLILAAATLPPGRELGWPLPRLFDRNAVLSANRPRQSVSVLGRPLAWFELTTKAEDAAILCFAAPADAAVSAETGLRDFMHTLTKTFAQLPIGLAIFDKDRKLQMFNPALVDLTTLPPDFLTKRPSLMAVLDAMRERNLLPEPKNYSNWRRQLVELEKAAASGQFQENWTLADGQTFRVTGRPHPNGALALMFDDISNETQRTRRYRADIELGQSVIDQLDDAIAVFGQAGQLIWSNTAYARFWGHETNQILNDATYRSLVTFWKTLSAPTSLWTEVDEYIQTIGDRQPWAADVRLLDGRLVTCRIAPVAAGATMIAFASASHGMGTKPALAQTEPNPEYTGELITQNSA
jgi:PAS domain-containing protein